MKPGVLEREQIVAAGHARAAVAHDVFRRHVAECLTQTAAQLLWRAEGARLVAVNRSIPVTATPLAPH